MKLLKKQLVRSRVICLAVAKRPIRAAQAGVGSEDCATEADQKIGNYDSCPCCDAYGVHRGAPAHPISGTPVPLALFHIQAGLPGSANRTFYLSPVARSSPANSFGGLC